MCLVPCVVYLVVCCAALRCAVLSPQPLDLAAWCSSQVPLHLPYVDLFEVHGGVSVQQQLPSYSEAFRGYGLNKQQHAWHAAALGFRFLVRGRGEAWDCVECRAAVVLVAVQR